MKDLELTVYAPAGVPDPAAWVELVSRHVMGVDQKGEPRPVEDFALFLYTSQRMGLDPLARQIYAVYRWDSRLGREKMAIQVGIDGMRLAAQRTGQYGGQDDAVYDPPDGSAKTPNKATVTVYRINSLTGERMPTTKSARWDEYAPYDRSGKLSGLWGRMPYLMLAKVAESLALRAAFPAELSGVHSSEEMEQAGPLLPVAARDRDEEPPHIIDASYQQVLIENGKAAAPAPALEDGTRPTCPNCDGPMWDNRTKKALGQMSERAPDFKCQNPECVTEHEKSEQPSLYWPGQWPPRPKPTREQLDEFIELGKQIWSGKNGRAAFRSWFPQHFPDVDLRNASSVSECFMRLSPEQGAAAIAAAQETIAAMAADPNQ